MTWPGRRDLGTGRLTARFGGSARRIPARLPGPTRLWSAETTAILSTPTRSPTVWDRWRQMWRGPERPGIEDSEE